MRASDRYKDIVIIGPVPPPIGGVSNHIARFSQRHNATVFPEGKIRSLRSTFKIFFLKNSTIFVHSESWYISFLLVLKYWIYKQNCEYMFVNHNFQTLTSYPTNLKQTIYQRFRYCFLRSCNKVFVVNPELIPKMKSVYGDLQIELFDPFIPPDESNEEKLIKEIGPEVMNFNKVHEPIIISGAWQLSFHNNEDLYGFDLLIELISHLKYNFPSIGLIFFIGNPEFNSSYLDSKKMRIDELGLNNSIYIISGQKEMWPLIKLSTLFIRATNTDGDPLSIKEALYFGTKVLASDCTVRVEGVRLFKSRSLESLIDKTESILKESSLT